MEKFKKLLKVYPPKDIQHFIYLLNRAEEEGMDIRTSRLVTQEFLRVEKLERKRPERIRQDPDRIISKGRYYKHCPDCGKGMNVAEHTDVENNRVNIAKCKNCQKSMIVEL